MASTSASVDITIPTRHRVSGRAHRWGRPDAPPKTAIDVPHPGLVRAGLHQLRQLAPGSVDVLVVGEVQVVVQGDPAQRPGHPQVPGPVPNVARAPGVVHVLQRRPAPSALVIPRLCKEVSATLVSLRAKLNSGRIHTMYMTKACMVSTLVVLRKFALLNAASVPIFMFSTSLAFCTLHTLSASASSMDTAALNHAANTTACIDARGS